MKKSGPIVHLTVLAWNVNRVATGAEESLLLEAIVRKRLVETVIGSGH
jgi:hypothetical protein